MHLKENESLEWLDDNLVVIQQKQGYRFTSDAISLAGFVKAKKSDLVVDLCSGSGVIGLMLHLKLNAKKTYLVEIQKRLADMSLRSVRANKLSNAVHVLNSPLQNINSVIGKSVCDVVVCNPPYKKKSSSLISKDTEIAIAKHELTITLEEIIKEGAKLLKPSGKFYIINKEERLAEILYLMKQYAIEPKTLKIKSAKGANVVLIEGVRGGKVGMKIEM